MATLKDIAQAAGVSKATASRVLNGRDSLVPISAETRQRILAAATELGYRPNLFARGLKTKRSYILGVAIRDVSNPFWGGLLKGINDVCSVRGYHVILSNTANEADEEVMAATFLGELGVDGILIVGDFPGDEKTIRRIVESCPMTVAVSRSLDPAIAPLVNIDNRLGIRLLMEHLYALGHRRIAFVGPTQLEGFAERHAAYRDFMAEHGLPVADHPVDETDLKAHFPSEDEMVDLGAAAARAILGSGEPVDAIVCACDPMAVGAMNVAHEMGLVVPRDLSIAGFDDRPLARYCRPALTTIRQPVGEMGQRAANLLIDLVEGNASRPTEAILFTPELTVRDSVAPRIVTVEGEGRR